MNKIKIYLAQINTIVGDINGNFNKIINNYQIACDHKCDLIIFPEMTICGYPAQDLWQKKYFIEKCQDKIIELTDFTKNKNCAIIVGCPTIDYNKKKEALIFNSALFINNGKVVDFSHKKTLPNYGVFDEKRYFQASTSLLISKFKDFKFNLMICEDVWELKNLYLSCENKTDFLIVINSSPYSIGKADQRFEKTEQFAKQIGKPLIYLNQIGGQDSLVFDGDSFVLGQYGEKLLEMKKFSEDFSIIEIDETHEIKVIEPKNHQSKFTQFQKKSHDLNLNCQITAKDNYCAAILGLRDYVLKNGFEKVLLGMSGGIDSAIVATIAVDALGSKNVELYALPSRFNSNNSMQDAKQCAQNLNIDLKIISIEPIHQIMLDSIKECSDLAKENIQSRIRGNILMAISNSRSKTLLLSTGNKSEMACGYATLYGDMCGAFNPIKDIYKTQIYQLAKWRNNNIPEISLYNKKNLIPENIISKEPTAELRENQKDSDSLPEYKILDQILYQIIEEEKAIEDIIEQGFDKDLVLKISKLFYFSEYKRKQSPIGPKISKMSFDLERRYPITNKFHD